MEDNDVPYRASPDVGPDKKSSTQDEADYSTLIGLKDYLLEELRKLKSTESLEENEEKDGLSIKEQLRANKKAEKIIEDALEIVQKGINDVEVDNEEGR